MEVVALPGSDSTGEEESANRWCPLDKERTERRRPAWKAQTKKGNEFPQRRHWHTTQTGQRGRLRPTGKVVPA
jgi:hypothetical protein